LAIEGQGMQVAVIACLPRWKELVIKEKEERSIRMGGGEGLFYETA